MIGTKEKTKREGKAKEKPKHASVPPKPWKIRKIHKNHKKIFFSQKYEKICFSHFFLYFRPKFFFPKKDFFGQKKFFGPKMAKKNFLGQKLQKKNFWPKIAKKNFVG